MREISNFIDELNDKLDETTLDYQKAELLYSIIQIRVENGEDLFFKNSLYVECKFFINSYIDSINNRNYGYDHIDFEKIIKVISYNLKDEEKISLTNYTRRKLKINGFEDKNKDLKAYVDKVKTNHILCRKFTIVNVFNLLKHITSYKFSALLISLFIIFCLTILLFLPAPIDKIALFELKYDNYSNDFMINHILNFLMKSVGLTDDFTIIPNGITGVIVLFLLKLFYLCVLINYLYKKIIEITFYGE